MENEWLWLRTSVFSGKEHWHRILEQIQVFIDFWKPQQCIKGFRLEFNYLSGENIRFSILCRDDFKQLIAQEFDIFFKDFFLRSNLPVRQQSLPINGIFLPHPPNSIRYGLYDMVGNDPENRQRDTVISSAIIQALYHEPIDEESVLTFAFYLYAGMLKAYKNCNKVFDDTYYHTNLFDNGRTDLIGIQIVRDRYENGKEMLSEIFEEIMNGIHVGPWLDNWVLSCETEVKRRSCGPFPQNDLTRTGLLFINSIHKHLGMSENMKLMLNFFMNETLKKRLLINK